MFPALALVGLAGILAAAIQLTKGPNLLRAAVGLKLPLTYVHSADKWARKRHLPLEWVLTTIMVESSGNPRATGDAGGKSVGLMQVNTAAHAAEMAAAGVTRDDLLFNPDTNIEWGTKYLNEYRGAVLAALRGRPAPAPLDEIVRLAYKGPASVLSALKRGQSPLALSWAPDAIANWRLRMAEVTALTRGGLRV